MNLETFNNKNIRKVIAGISGGADSVAMLRAYISSGVELIAVHCNFHLRGEESDRDQKFVMDLCRNFNITLFVFEFDTKKYCTKYRLSLEEACRELRYSKFRVLKERFKADRIAVAHNANDNAETFFLNLMRGAGIKGLKAMYADTGEIVRPLLGIFREEIFKYLHSIGQNFVIDSTNKDSNFRRNFIRNNIIPVLEKEWPGALKSINNSISHLKEDYEILENIDKEILEGSSKKLTYNKILSFTNPHRLIYRFINKFGGSYIQAQEILNCISKDDFISGKRWLMNEGMIVAERNFLEFISNSETSFEVSCFNYRMNDDLIQKIHHAPLSELWTDLPENEIVFRFAKEGDKIMSLGINGKVKVSKIMKDAKLSYSEKGKIVIAENKNTGEIIWVLGLKRSRHNLIDDKTQTAYKYIINFN